MMLRYCDNLRNFGDAINPSFWAHFAPHCMNDDPCELFCGIGTILSRHIPSAPLKVVLGSGAGYDAPPKVDARWRIYFVRGPLTARALGISRSYALTDPAILLPMWHAPAPAKKYRVSYMPHHLSARQADWSGVCGEAGVHYIDPDAPVPSVIDDICASELVITEALHGAVAADAYRVPWLPVVCYPHVLEFKWADWCASLKVPYLPLRLRPLWDVSFRGGIAKRLKIIAKRAIHRVRADGASRTEPRPLKSPDADFAWVTESLSRLAEQCAPCLSTEREHEIASEQVANAIDCFTKDCDSRVLHDGTWPYRLEQASGI